MPPKSIKRPPIRAALFILFDMPTLQEITAKMYSHQKEIIERLQDYFQSPSDLFDAIESNSDRLNEAIHEYADGEVSVYTSDRLQWAADHQGEISNYEEEAIDCGSKTMEGIAAFCWYSSVQQEAFDAVAKAQEYINE